MYLRMQIKYIWVHMFKTILYEKYNYSLFPDSAFSFISVSFVIILSPTF